MVILDDVNLGVNKVLLKTDDGKKQLLSQMRYLIHLTFFVNIGPKLASGIKHTGKDFFYYLLNPTQKSLFMKPILADEIVKIISKFNQNKSPGHDGIGNFIVKNVAHIISGPLADIFNLSLSTGSVLE